MREKSEYNAPFNGKQFSNLEPIPDKSIWDLIKWRWSSFSNSVSWEGEYSLTQSLPKSQRSQDLQYVVINHATVLVQLDGINILTDPHFSDRASPVSFTGPKRHIPPGIRFEDLPPIDVVLISHNHYDHLDLPSLRRLSQVHSPLFLAGLGTEKFLKDEGVLNVRELDWWEEIKVKAIKLTFTPAQHWSARGLFDRKEMLWGGFFIKGSKAVYFAGDTGMGKFFKLIAERLGAPDLAILPIGAYEPRWFMRPSHINPQESVQAFIDVKATKAVGMHFGTFKLTDEGRDTPIKDLEKALAEKDLNPTMFLVPEFGRTYSW